MSGIYKPFWCAKVNTGLLKTTNTSIFFHTFLVGNSLFQSISFPYEEKDVKEIHNHGFIFKIIENSDHCRKYFILTWPSPLTSILLSIAMLVGRKMIKGAYFL